MGRTIVYTEPPTHAFHFFLEWAFHLHASLAEGPPADALLLLSVSALKGRRTSRLDAWSGRVYEALIQRFKRVVRASTDVTYCVQRARIGLAPEVSLLASRCLALRRLAEPRNPTAAPAACAGDPRTDVQDETTLPEAHRLARRLTNCSLTRTRLRNFRTFVRAHLALRASATSVFSSTSSGIRAAARATLVARRTAPRGDSGGGSGGGRSDGGSGGSDSGGGDSDVLRILLVQRTGNMRRLLGLRPFADRLATVLLALRAIWRPSQQREGDGPAVEVRVADFTADLSSNAALLQSYAALVAVHGNALTNLVLTPSRGTLRAAVQLLPTCLPEKTMSNHAYEVLGDTLLRGRFRSVCCACEAPLTGKASNVHCNATLTAHVLAGLLRPRAQRVPN